MQFYYHDPTDQLYKVTTAEKLQNYLRALILKCAEEMPKDVNVVSLFSTFRSDKVQKQIIQRAESILAADESFFCATSPHKRKQGPELPERLARVFIESMLEKREGSILTVTQAYALFSNLSSQNQLQPIKRTTFRQLMVDLMKDSFGICLRRDIKDEQGKAQEGWKGVGKNYTEPKSQTCTT
jgi:hypothetical protein